MLNIGFNRALMLVLGLVMALVLLASPSFASDYSTANRCKDYGADSSCAHFEWSKQADGTGVVLNRVGEYSTCTNHNDPAYKNVTVEMLPITGFASPYYAFNYGGENCDYSHGSIDWRGKDTGGMQVTLKEHANLHLLADKCIEFKWEIYGNGASNYLGATVDDGSVC